MVAELIATGSVVTVLELRAARRTVETKIQHECVRLVSHVERMLGGGVGNCLPHHVRKTLDGDVQSIRVLEQERRDLDQRLEEAETRLAIERRVDENHQIARDAVAQRQASSSFLSDDHRLEVHP